MKVIPVIDLKAGQVVHARRGDRAHYEPIVSPLCAGSRPVDVVAALLDIHPFDTLYIADLGAIQGEGDHRAEIARLHRRFPELGLWVDCGVAGDAACRRWLAEIPGLLVVGSEALEDAGIFERLADLPQERLALSLDFRGDRFMGPPDLLDRPALWPDRLVVMTLSRVGSGAGPDFDRLGEIKGRAGARQIFAAGGVRGGEDLFELAGQGISGVLVASALHDRRIGHVEIAAAAAAPVMS